MLVNEIFDQPYELETDTTITKAISNWTLAQNLDISGLRVYAVKNDTDNIFMMYRTNDGYWETHHAYKSEDVYRSGVKLGTDISAATKYISTVTLLYKQLLDRGSRIRILTTQTSGMWPTYQKIIKRLIRGAENQYNVGEEQKSISIDGIPSVSMTIEPRGRTLLEGFVHQ